jgi:hypothetical protein
MPRIPSIVALILFAASQACSDPNELADAVLTNAVDTITLYSLATGPLAEPSAYSLNGRRGVRTWDAGTNFEFVFTTDPADRGYFLPLDLLGLLPEGAFKPGMQRSNLAFDEMTRAPLNGYITSDTLQVAEHDRFFIRTGINTCAGLGVPLYGKVEVLDIDTTSATVTFQVLANQNCGYRGLLVGIPKN